MFARPRLSTFATLFAFGWLAIAPSRSNAAAPAQSGNRNPTSATNRIYPTLDPLRPDAASGAVGIISAYAGNGYGDGGSVGGYSGDGHAATSAELGGPSGIAIDSQGNLFIADTQNNRIRRVDHQTLIITTVAGGVADSNEDCATYFLCGDGGPATSAILSSPMGVAVDSSGNIYIADTGNNAIRKVDAKGVISTLAGKGFFYGGYTGDGHAATEAELKAPEGVAVDSVGNVYIADTDNGCVRKITETTGIITTLASGMIPTQIALDASGNLYVTDIGELTGPYSLIQVVNAKTHVVTTFAGNTDGQVCSASADGYGDGCVATGTILVNPNGIAFDSAGDVYISDAGGEIVHRIDAKTQIATAVAGNGNQGFNANGIPATSAELDFPFGLAFDPLGNLYLADSYNQLVRKVTYNSASVTPTPTFSPAPGSYTAAVDVTLADSASGAKIYYTVDVTTPTIPATGTTKLYSAAIPVSETTTIKAIAVAGTDADSAVATGTYTFPKPAATPVFSVAAGTYNVAQSVKITDATAGATIYYTVNGATPTTASTKYTGPVSVAATETLEAIAIASGYTQSSVASAKYIIDTEKQAAPPVFSPAVGTYTTTETVTITGSTPGSVIYYTTNGAIPTSASTKYTAPVLVTQSTDFQAIAIAPGYTNSPVASAEYTLIGWPSGIASPASSITASSAVLNAFVNTQGLSGTCYFQYGTSATALTSTTAKTPVAASTAPAKASAALTGLKANTEYYFQFVVSTAAGGALGPVLSFTTN